MPAHFHLFKFLSTKQNRTNIDHLMSVAAVIHPLMALPQVFQLYSTKEAAGLSVFMWAAWLVLGMVFLAYGLAHRLKPYILMQVLWIMVDVVMITGILIYG
ncbi:MAG TPA: PQ-loop domain-containing transporter [Candidatus Saccharimonadales bacterium]